MKFAKMLFVVTSVLTVAESVLGQNVIRVIPTGRNGNITWKYSRNSRLSANWKELSFSDASWESGISGFGSSGTERKTSWSGEGTDLYLRNQFKFDYKVGEIESVSLIYAIDDEVEVWLNGGQLFRMVHNKRYKYASADVTDQFKRLARESGRNNVIAVRAHNNRGNCYVDVGLDVVLSSSAQKCELGKNAEKEDLAKMSNDSEEEADLDVNVSDESNEENCAVPKYQRSYAANVPNKSAVERAVGTMVELCGDDVAAAKEGKISKLQLASKFLDYNRKTDDLSLKFVLLRNAFRQFVLANKFDMARELLFKVVDEFGGRFAAGVAEQSSSLIEKKLKSGNSASALQSVVAEMKTAIAEIDEAEMALKRASANFGERKRLALNSAIIGNWFAALSAYSEMEGQQGAMAKWELDYPKSAEEGLSAEIVGDKWWSMSEGKDERSLAFHSFTVHAEFWYRKALAEGNMDAIKIALVQKRLKQLER